MLEGVRWSIEGKRGLQHGPLGVTHFVLSAKHAALPLVGGDVALPHCFHLALTVLVTFPGVYVKNSSDIGGKKMYCHVYHVCNPMLTPVLELYCNLKRVNKILNCTLGLQPSVLLATELSTPPLIPAHED